MPQDWHPEDIKAAVRKRGTTLAAIGRRMGKRRNAVGQALDKPRKAAEIAIAEVLDVHPKVIWPSRYNADGTRKTPQPTTNYRAQARLGNPA